MTLSKTPLHLVKTAKPHGVRWQPFAKKWAVLARGESTETYHATLPEAMSEYYRRSGEARRLRKELLR